MKEATGTEDQTAIYPYYEYVAGTGNERNTSSRWANAKNSDGTYFVWIPRYAYRITYYSGYTVDENQNTIPTGNPTGYYDGLGQWRASDGKIRCALDSGIETVDYNGKKYIVHPAFCGTQVGYDNGSCVNYKGNFTKTYTKEEIKDWFIKQGYTIISE